MHCCIVCFTWLGMYCTFPCTPGTAAPCRRPLGVSTGEVHDGNMNASSWGPGTPPWRARLGDHVGWCAGDGDLAPVLEVWLWAIIRRLSSFHTLYSVHNNTVILTKCLLLKCLLSHICLFVTFMQNTYFASSIIIFIYYIRLIALDKA